MVQPSPVINTEEVTEEEAKILLRMNAVFGSFFVVGLIATFYMLYKRNISDLFIRRSLYCMIGALLVTIIACFIMTSYEPQLFLNE